MLNECTEEVNKKINGLLKKMTIGEKIGQLVQYGRLHDEENKLVKDGKIGSFLNVSGAEIINRLQTEIMGSDCSIPLIIGDDVIHGYKTIFPIPLAESCSWDMDIIEEDSAIGAREASCEGINMIFAPMVDIARDPRWGRVAEGAGEDTYLGSEIARARVRGIQRNDWDDRPYVTACPKHFLGYGAVEGGRDYNSVDMSERSIREVYLPPFKAAVDEGAMSMMCSFNDLNGFPPSGNRFLLSTILRDELGFQGTLVSDWESIEELINHGLAGDKKQASFKAINAGVDLDMHSGCYDENLAALVREGSVNEEIIDTSARRVLKTKYAVNLFSSHHIDPDLSSKVIRCDDHIRTALKSAEESIVLLKNSGNLLPLNKGLKSIALIGPLADDTETPLGCWACKGSPDNVVSVLGGLENKIGGKIKINYAKGCGVLDGIDGGIDEAVDAAKKSEVVVMALGESRNMSGENNNRAFIDIPLAQRKLLKAVYNVNKNIVLVLMNGRPLALQWEDDNIPAILEAWHLGEQSGNAIANVLTGGFNPCGKITMTFPRCLGQVPIYYNHKNTGRPWSNKYVDMQETPLYPFGYGLSYTKFEYRDLMLSADSMKSGRSITVQASVKNTGDMEGTEVVQLYVRDVVSSVTRPVKELKGFQRISLKPGEARQVTFKLGDRELGFLDSDFKFTVEPGLFKVWVGPNSSEGLEGEFEVVE